VKVSVTKFNRGCGHRARVKASTQKNSYRHIGCDQPKLNGVQEQTREFPIADFV
jgi:hypothetical protein